MAKASERGTVLAQGLRALKTMMEKHGLDYAAAARAVDIDPGAADDGDKRISLRAFAQMLENVAHDTGNDALGVQLSDSFEIGIGGAIDYVIANAPTLRVALADHVRFLHLVAEGIDTKLEVGPRVSHVVADLPASFGPRAQLIDATTGVRVARIRRIMGNPEFPITIELERKRPKAIEEFHRILGPRLRFERAENRIGIDTRALDEKLPTADPRLYQVVRQAAEKMLTERERSHGTLFRVTSHIGSNLAHGDMKLANAAQAISLSPAQLRRELARAHTTFRELVDDTRRSMAEHYIHETTLPMTEIAFLLGFSELSAFSRAARNWFGRAPRALRQRLRA